MDIKPNAIYQCDSLSLLERFNDDYIDLVFLDPPFLVDDNILQLSFQQINPDKNFTSYLDFISRIIQQSHRVLKEDGNLAIHISPKLSNFIRILLDENFKRKNYRNEFIIPNKHIGRFTQQRPSQTVMIFYAKSEKSKLNTITRKFTPEDLNNELVYKYKDSELGYLLQDNNDFAKLFEEMDWQIKVGNIWDDIESKSWHQQKNNFLGFLDIEVVKRVIKIGTNEGDLIFDAFLGSGVSLIGANELNRKWIGCDKSEDMIELAVKALEEIGLEANKDFSLFNDEKSINKIPPVARKYFKPFEWLSFGSSKKFIHGQVLKIEETRNYEFKEIKGNNPVKTIINTIEDYVVAFLNSEGGTIYWGVKDGNREIIGVNLNYEQRDELRRVVWEKLSCISPSIAPTEYKFEIHQIEDVHGNLLDLYIVEVIIPQSLGIELYFNHSGQAIIKTDGGKKTLNGAEVNEEIIARYKNRNN